LIISPGRQSKRELLKSGGQQQKPFINRKKVCSALLGEACGGKLGGSLLQRVFPQKARGKSFLLGESGSLSKSKIQQGAARQKRDEGAIWQKKACGRGKKVL